MTERRFKVDHLIEQGGIISLSSDVADHVRVLRLRVGDEVTLFDGQGKRAQGYIIEMDAFVVKVQAAIPVMVPRPQQRVHLIQAFPKRNVLEDLLRSVTEIGVTSIHLAISEHSVTKTVSERTPHQYERYQRIMSDAARQCERDDIPTLYEPAPLFEVALRAPQEDMRVVCCGRTGKTWPRSNLDQWLVIGPEGGLSQHEMNTLQSMNFNMVSLGPHVLRVATAATVAVGMSINQFSC